MHRTVWQTVRFSDDETHAARSEFRAWFAHVQFPLPPEALTRKDCTKPVQHPNVKEMQIFALMPFLLKQQALIHVTMPTQLKSET